MSCEFQRLVSLARQVIDADIALGIEHFPRNRNTIEPLRIHRRRAGAGTGAPSPQTDARLEPLGEVTDKGAELEKLKEQLAECSRCCLGATRTNLVFGEGDPNAELMIIGEAPGEDEDLSGKPFVGRAGKLLTQMINAMGLTREQIYIANVLKCRPPGNRPPKPDEVAICKPYLFRQIQIIQPKVILTLGNPAMHTLLGVTGITRLRGQWQELPELAPGIGGIAVMPTYHPSYVLRNYTPQTRGEAWQDLQKIMARLGLKKPAE